VVLQPTLHLGSLNNRRVTKRLDGTAMFEAAAPFGSYVEPDGCRSDVPAGSSAWLARDRCTD